jgi:hypothetical protein
MSSVHDHHHHHHQNGTTTPPRLSTSGDVFTPLLQPHAHASSSNLVGKNSTSPWSDSLFLFLCREAVTVLLAECLWILFRYIAAMLHLLQSHIIVVSVKESDSFWWRFLRVLLWLRIQEITSVIPFWPTRVCEMLWRHPKNSRTSPARNVGFSIGAILFTFVWIRLLQFLYLLKEPMVPTSSSPMEMDAWTRQFVYQTLPSCIRMAIFSIGILVLPELFEINRMFPAKYILTSLFMTPFFDGGNLEIELFLSRDWVGIMRITIPRFFGGIVVASHCLRKYFPYDNSNYRHEDNLIRKSR